MTPEDTALAMIRAGDWGNRINRATGVPIRTIHRIAHDNGLTVKPAPVSARGSKRLGKAQVARVYAISDPETEWRGRKAQARW